VGKQGARKGSRSTRYQRNKCFVLWERKAPWQYIEMMCGHLSTPEEQESYRVFRPRKAVVYCDKCSQWVTRMPKAKPKPLPQDPMF